MFGSDIFNNEFKLGEDATLVEGLRAGLEYLDYALGTSASRRALSKAQVKTIQPGITPPLWQALFNHYSGSLRDLFIDEMAEALKLYRTLRATDFRLVTHEGVTTCLRSRHVRLPYPCKCLLIADLQAWFNGVIYFITPKYAPPAGVGLAYLASLGTVIPGVGGSTKPGAGSNATTRTTTTTTTSSSSSSSAAPKLGTLVMRVGDIEVAGDGEALEGYFERTSCTQDVSQIHLHRPGARQTLPRMEARGSLYTPEAAAARAEWGRGGGDSGAGGGDSGAGGGDSGAEGGDSGTEGSDEREHEDEREHVDEEGDPPRERGQTRKRSGQRKRPRLASAAALKRRRTDGVSVRFSLVSSSPPGLPPPRCLSALSAGDVGEPAGEVGPESAVGDLPRFALRPAGALAVEAVRAAFRDEEVRTALDRAAQKAPHGRPSLVPGNLASRIRRKGDSTAPDKRKDRSQGVWDGMESAFTHVWPKSTGRIVLGPNRDKPEALMHCVLTLEVLTRDYIAPFQEEPPSGDGRRVGSTYSGLVRAGASKLPPQARFRRKEFEADIQGVIDRLQRKQGRQGASSASARASRRVRGGNRDHGDGDGDDGEGDDGEGDGELDPRQSEGDGDLPWGAYDDPADDLLSDSLSEGEDLGPGSEEGNETKRELLEELKKVVNATMATSEEHLNAAFSLGEDELRLLLQAVKKVKAGSDAVHDTLAAYLMSPKRSK